MLIIFKTGPMQSLINAYAINIEYIAYIYFIFCICAVK